MGLQDENRESFDDALAKANSSVVSKSQAPIDATTLASLQTLSKDALIALVERMARQCGLVANMTKEETAQAMLDTLAATALKPIAFGMSMKADIQSRIAAIDKWLDRAEGKPMQRVDTRNLHAYTLMPTVTRNGKEVTFNVGKPVTLDLESVNI